MRGVWVDERRRRLALVDQQEAEKRDSTGPGQTSGRGVSCVFSLDRQDSKPGYARDVVLLMPSRGKVVQSGKK